jgi:acyl carrier protein
MSILEGLEQFLLNEIAVDLGKKFLKADEDLLEQGIIDSLGIMKLVLFMEKTYGIEVSDEEIVPENFQDLKSIVKFVERKQVKK